MQKVGTLRVQLNFLCAAMSKLHVTLLDPLIKLPNYIGFPHYQLNLGLKRQLTTLPHTEAFPSLCLT